MLTSTEKARIPVTVDLFQRFLSFVRSTTLLPAPESQQFTTAAIISVLIPIIISEQVYWLPAEQRISYRIASLVWRCLVGLAPVYLRELCCPPLSAMSSRSLRSSQQGLLL